MGHLVVLFHQNNQGLPILVNQLTKEGFSAYSFPFESNWWRIVQKKEPSLIVFEFENDENELIEALYKIKSDDSRISKTPVVFLTGIKDEFFQLAAYEAGIDDIIIQPIKPRLFYYKINRLLKQNKTTKHKIENPSTHIAINRERFVVIKTGKEYHLSRKEFELLELLLSRPNKVYTREEISAAVWNSVDTSRTRTIDVHIRKLRDKLGEEVIKTVKGVGYSAVQ